MANVCPQRILLRPSIYYDFFVFVRFYAVTASQSRVPSIASTATLVTPRFPFTAAVSIKKKIPFNGEINSVASLCNRQPIWSGNMNAHKNNDEAEFTRTHTQASNSLHVAQSS
jgi:hypothetical protein